MKTCLLLTLTLLTAGTLAGGGLPEFIGSIVNLFATDVADVNDGLFKEFDGLQGPDKATAGLFGRPKEDDPAKPAITEKVDDLKITGKHRVAHNCFIPKQGNTPVAPLFCYQIWILPNPNASAKKDQKKSLVILIHLSSAVVTSRIKATLASTAKSKIIDAIFRRGIQKFLARLDQTIPTLAAFLPDLVPAGDPKAQQAEEKSTLQNILADIKIAEKTPDGFDNFEVESLEVNMGRQAKPLEKIKKLTENKDLEPKKTAEIIKFFESKTRSQKPDPNLKEPLQELVLLIIRPSKESEQVPSELFDELIREIYLALVNVEGRISVHLRSDAFFFSKDLPTATKPALLSTIQSLLHKALKQTYQTLLDLDTVPPLASNEGADIESAITTTFESQLFAKVKELVAPLEFETTQNEPGKISLGGSDSPYSILVSVNPVEGHGDLEVRVVLVQGTAVDKPLRSRSTFLPIQSQFYLVDFASNFVFEVVLNFLESVVSLYITPGSAPQKDTEDLRTFLANAAYLLSAGQTEAFIPSDPVNKLLNEGYRVPKDLTGDNNFVRGPLYQLSWPVPSIREKDASRKILKMVLGKTSDENFSDENSSLAFSQSFSGLLRGAAKIETTTTTTTTYTYFQKLDSGAVKAEK